MLIQDLKNLEPLIEAYKKIMPNLGFLECYGDWDITDFYTMIKYYFTIQPTIYTEAYNAFDSIITKEYENGK